MEAQIITYLSTSVTLPERAQTLEARKALKVLNRDRSDEELQMESLQVIANAYGNKWKEVLCQRWVSGREFEFDYALEEYGLEMCYLRQLRNRKGPTWLIKECKIEPANKNLKTMFLS